MTITKIILERLVENEFDQQILESFLEDISEYFVFKGLEYCVLVIKVPTKKPLVIELEEVIDKELSIQEVKDFIEEKIKGEE